MDHECCCPLASPPLVAEGNPPAAGAGAGAALTALFPCRLERCADRVDASDDSGGGPGVCEQAGLRPEGPLHHMASGAMGQPDARGCGGFLLAARRDAVGEAGGGHARGHGGTASRPSDFEWACGGLRSAGTGRGAGCDVCRPHPGGVCHGAVAGPEPCCGGHARGSGGARFWAGAGGGGPLFHDGGQPG
jgi:hypothetical protein